MLRPTTALTALCLAASVRHATPDDISDLLDKFRVLDTDLFARIEYVYPVDEENPVNFCEREDSKTFWSLLVAIAEQQERNHRLAGKASLGYSRNAIGSFSSRTEGLPLVDGIVENDDIRAAIDLRRGTYPGEFRFNAEVGIRAERTRATNVQRIEEETTKVRENVSKLDVSYDYYAHPALEFYVFGSRYTDEFMRIDQRYEVGFGTVFEFTEIFDFGKQRAKNYGDPKKLMSFPRPRDVSTGAMPPAEPRDAQYKLVRELKRLADGSSESEPAWMSCYIDMVEGADADDEDVPSIAKEVLELLYAAWNGQQQGHARWRFALLAGVFAELERATLPVPVTAPQSIGGTDATGTPQTITVDRTTVVSESIDPKQRFRWELRPTFRFRPTERFTLSAHHYWKLPIDDTYSDLDGSAPDEVYDFRMETEVKAEFSVTDAELGQPGDVGVEILYRRFSDSVPPYLRAPATAGMMAAMEPGPLVFAPGSREYFGINFTIKWN